MLQFENNLLEEPIVLKDGNKIWLTRYKIGIFFLYDSVAFIEDCQETDTPCARRADIEDFNFNDILRRARIRASVMYQTPIYLENVHVYAYIQMFARVRKSQNIFAFELNMFQNFSTNGSVKSSRTANIKYI